jgi:poly-gamma-glutamate synthesis protein (capsule biosynthesis protein)
MLLQLMTTSLLMNTGLSRRSLLSLLGGAPALASGGRETRLLFGGDVLLCRHIGQLARQKQDPAWPLRGIAGVLSAADIACVNLESPFSDKGKPVTQGMVFKAEPEMVGALKVAGIDLVSTANNHARDRGSYGIEFTVRWLRENGIGAVGTGATAEAAHEGVVMPRNGVRFGFLAYAQDQANGNWPDLDERVCVMDITRMQRDVALMKTRADVITVSMHAGVEYGTRVHPLQTRFAQAAIHAGARIVVGHHPHVVQPWERFGAGVIFYSLGNLVFDQFDRKSTQQGLLAEVIFAGQEMVRVNAIPVALEGGQPRIAPLSACRNDRLGGSVDVA